MTVTERQTVLVIDDHPLVRNGLRRLFELGEDFQFVGEAADGATGLDLAKQLNPDLIVLDISMKGMNGIETLKAIKAADLDSQVIMLTYSDDEDILMSALRGGADGFLLKSMDIDEVCEKLGSASQGKLVLSEELVDKLVRAQRKKGHLTDPGLTDREWEIVNLIVEGLANKAIARRLDITEGTVKQHIKNVFKKTNLHSRLEVAIWGRDKCQKHGG